MLSEFKEHITSQFPYLEGKKLLVAISGGIDSVVATHLLHKLGFAISLAHCNFSLRGKESDKDEKFVKKLATEISCKAFTKTFDTENYAATNGISIQMAARELRYKWFEEIRLQENLDYIITAHHQEDELETFLINLCRGTGLSGLTGIPAINNMVIRPLLPFSRNDILIYATKHKLKWREDASNTSLKYTRNKIRHKVVPVLKELNPNLLDNFKKTVSHLQDSLTIIQDYIRQLKADVSVEHPTHISFDIDKINQLSNTKAYLYFLFNEYGFTAWNDIEKLLEAQSGKYITSATHKLLKNRNELLVSCLSKEEIQNTILVHEGLKNINEPIHLSFENKNDIDTTFLSSIALNTSNEVCIDYHKLDFPLELRKWQKGDAFYPIGMNGKKKISKYFKDEKLSGLQKENTWLLCSKNSIVWVVGMRLDERFKLTKHSSKAYCIKFHK